MNPEVLVDLALKLAYTVPQFSTDWAARELHLPMPLVDELLQHLKREQMVQILGQVGAFNYRYAISERGRERAARLFEISGYVGPAPVSLESYTAMLEFQLAHAPPVLPQDVSAAISSLVMPEEDVLRAGLAISSGRSLFLFGPAGNGKTTLGRLLHSALRGDLWIPHCIGIESTIIRIFDAQCHRIADDEVAQSRTVDQRWVKIRRPLIVVGGELTIEALDLAYSPALRFYEAPLHLKSNGGTLLIDDFGRQRVNAHELLNRWIIPLEHQIDHLTLHTGVKIDVPFRQMLIFATNLSLEDVTDPAFLRRMGYRLYLGRPSPERYAHIFARFAERCGTTVEPEVIARLLDRYRVERRELRGCEPRDLIERARDICRFMSRPLELTDKILHLAWTGYFGNQNTGTSV